MHSIYNRPKSKLNNADSANAKVQVIQNITNQLANIVNCLPYLLTDKHKQASDNILQSVNSIKDLINSAKLNPSTKISLADTMDQIWQNIRATNNLADLQGLMCRVKCFQVDVGQNIEADEVLNIFANNYFSENQSIMVDEFYYTQENSIRCENCGFDKISYNVQNIVIFPLQKVYEHKLRKKINEVHLLIDQLSTKPSQLNVNILKLQQNLYTEQQRMLDLEGAAMNTATESAKNASRMLIQQAQYNLDVAFAQQAMSPEQHRVYQLQKEISSSLVHEKIVAIQDCFLQFKEAELLSEANQIYCNSCGKLSNAENTNKFKTLPKKMTMIFNRGKGIEFNVKIKHADYIDPWDILDLDPTNCQCFQWINVRANLLHAGPSGMAGHFYSAIRSGKDNKPRTYNDVMVSDRSTIEAGIQYGSHEMPYVWFTDTMTLQSEIDTILEKVTDARFRNAICTKFLSLGVLDAQEGKNSINKNRQMIFAYLLMYAFETCIANKDMVTHQIQQYNESSRKDEVIQCHKATNKHFEQYLSDFICDTFNMIASRDNFDFDSNRQETLNQIKKWRSTILNCAQNAQYNPDIKNPVSFNIHNDQLNNNNNIINQLNNINIIPQGNNNMQNNINNNQLNNNNIINNNTSGSNVPTLNRTLKFEFNGNTFEKTINDVNNNAATIQEIFNKIAEDHSDTFSNYQKFEIKLTNQLNMNSNEIFACKVVDLDRYMQSNALNFQVSGEKVQQYDNIGNQSSQYDHNASESSKYQPLSKKLWTWLKFIFATIFAAGAIVAVIFDSGILAAILLAAALLTLFGKLIFSSCVRCCRPQDYDYDTTFTESQYKDDNKLSNDYNQNYPRSKSQNQYENNQQN